MFTKLPYSQTEFFLRSAGLLTFCQFSFSNEAFVASLTRWLVFSLEPLYQLYHSTNKTSHLPFKIPFSPPLELQNRAVASIVEF